MSLPNGWKKKSALDVLTLQGGYAFKSTDAQSSGVKWLKIANVGISQIKWEDESFLPYEFWEEHPNFQLNDGDIVVAMTRPLLGLKLKIARLGKADVPALLNQRVGRILPSSGVDKDFIYQTLTTKTVAKQFDADLLGTDPPNLGVQTFKRTKILIPPLPEQKAIADLLSTWDSAIEKTERLIAAKEKALEAYGRDLFDKSNEGKQAGWKVVKLKTVLTEHGDKSTGSEEVFSVSVHKGLVNQIEHLGRSFSADNTDHYNRVHYGDIVYTKSPTGDFPLGIVKQSYTKEDVLVSPLYGVFTPKSFDLGVALDFYFSSPARARNYLFPIIQKGAKNTIAITNKTFLSKTLHLPVEADAQKKLGEFLIAAKEEIAVLKSLAKKYKEQKRGLMQKLLTGEWRVKIANGGEVK